MSNAATRVITPEFTVSYPHLDKPQASEEGGKAKYSMACVFDPGTNLDALKAAAMAAAEAKWPGKAAEMLRTRSIRSPFRDDAEAKGYAEGSIFINVRSDNKPQVVYRHSSNGSTPDVMPEEKVREEVYAGSRARASLNAFAYDRNGNRGISFALNNVQKMGEGKRIDGRKDATSEFDADLSQAPADISSLL